jgi:formate dehydrogenase major subunit
MIAPRKIKLTIDGKPCEGTEGQTILEIARANDVYIPTLCYLKHLTPWGGCRMCICEVKGSAKIVPSCTTPAQDGSEVTVKSDRLVGLRRATLELLFSERNHICPICTYNKGDCGLQHQAYVHNLDHVGIPYLYPAMPVDLTGKYFGIDHNRCILCTRCVRACDEMEGVHTLDVANRGAKNVVVVDNLTTFGQSSTCTMCGACVTSCPTGALFDKASAFLGQLTKSETVRTTCRECPVGCGLLVYVRDGRVLNVQGDFESPVNKGHLCVRGRYQTWADPRTRISQPMIRRGGALQTVTWDAARAAIADMLQNVTANHRALLVAPRSTNETVQTVKAVHGQFNRVAMRVANHESALCETAAGSSTSVGVLDDADAIVLLGVNPARHNPVIAAKIRATVRKRGAKLVILHGRRSDLDFIADMTAHEVGVERAFWKKVGDVLQGSRRPVLVYGPRAMTPVGVTAMDHLITVFGSLTGSQDPKLLPLTIGTNCLAATTAGIEPIEDVGPWLDASPLGYLHIVAGDEPDGGASLLDEKHVARLLREIECVVVQAAYESPLIELAHLVLPSAAWSETAGTTTNIEGRSLPLKAVFPARGGARSDQHILETMFA